MMIFLPTGSGNGDGFSECFAGFITRVSWWFFAVIICGVITQEFLPAYSWICFIPIVCMVIHIMIYMKLYDKKKKKKNKE